MIPYTYRIGWSDQNRYYYGVRYSKDAHPNDLWKTYFTSSKHVKHYAKKYGDPDVLEIRRTFGSGDDARLWEKKVLVRANLKENTAYLNHTNNGAPPPVEFDRAKNFRNGDPTRRQFKDLSEAKREELRRIISKNTTQQHIDGRVNYKKPDDTTNYKKSALKRWSDPEFAKSRQGWKWMNKDGSSLQVLEQDWDVRLENGWVFGRKS